MYRLGKITDWPLSRYIRFHRPDSNWYLSVHVITLFLMNQRNQNCLCAIITHENASHLWNCVDNGKTDFPFERQTKRVKGLSVLKIAAITLCVRETWSPKKCRVCSLRAAAMLIRQQHIYWRWFWEHFEWKGTIRREIWCNISTFFQDKHTFLKKGKETPISFYLKTCFTVFLHTLDSKVCIK